MTDEPQFTIAQVVAVYHDRLACDFTSQRELIDHMAGQRVPIWDIPVVLKLAKPALKRQWRCTRPIPWQRNDRGSGNRTGAALRRHRHQPGVSGPVTDASKAIRGNPGNHRHLIPA